MPACLNYSINYSRDRRGAVHAKSSLEDSLVTPAAGSATSRPGHCQRLRGLCDPSKFSEGRTSHFLVSPGYAAQRCKYTRSALNTSGWADSLNDLLLKLGMYFSGVYFETLQVRGGESPWSLIPSPQQG